MKQSANATKGKSFANAFAVILWEMALICWSFFVCSFPMLHGSSATTFNRRMQNGKWSEVKWWWLVVERRDMQIYEKLSLNRIRIAGCWTSYLKTIGYINYIWKWMRFACILCSHVAYRLHLFINIFEQQRPWKQCCISNEVCEQWAQVTNTRNTRKRCAFFYAFHIHYFAELISTPFDWAIVFRRTCVCLWYDNVIGANILHSAVCSTHNIQSTFLHLTKVCKWTFPMRLEQQSVFQPPPPPFLTQQMHDNQLVYMAFPNVGEFYRTLKFARTIYLLLFRCVWFGVRSSKLANICLHPCPVVTIYKSRFMLSCRGIQFRRSTECRKRLINDSLSYAIERKICKKGNIRYLPCRLVSPIYSYI